MLKNDSNANHASGQQNREEIDDEPFVLRNDPPKRKPWQPPYTPPARQRLLFDGLDCLPGQMDLF